MPCPREQALLFEGGTIALFVSAKSSWHCKVPTTAAGSFVTHVSKPECQFSTNGEIKGALCAASLCVAVGCAAGRVDAFEVQVQEAAVEVGSPLPCECSDFNFLVKLRIPCAPPPSTCAQWRVSVCTGNNRFHPRRRGLGRHRNRYLFMFFFNPLYTHHADNGLVV